MTGFSEKDILMEDQDILVVRKHAQMAVQSARPGQMDLEHALLNYLQQKKNSERAAKNSRTIPYLGVIHRLDQPVEGILVFAKTQSAAGKLNQQLQNGTMCKEYLAVCEGTMPSEKGILEDLLKKDSRTNTSMVVTAGTQGAKKAKLEYQVLQQKEEYSLVKIHLLTGRHHQIRVQFSHAGCPLAGDAKYGAEKSKGSLALCASHLVFLHPKTGKTMEFSIQPENERFAKFL